MNVHQSSVLMNTKVAKQAFGKHKTQSVLPEGRPRLRGKICRRQRAERSECRDI